MEYKIAIVSKIPGLGNIVKKRIGGNFVPSLSLGCNPKLSLSIPKITDPNAISASLKGANIVFGDPSLLEPHLRNPDLNFSSLEWIHSTWAGVEGMVQLARDLSSRYQQNEVDARLEDGESLKKKAKVAQTNSPFLITRMADVFGPHMAEYCIGHIIRLERQFERFALDQKQRRWEVKDYRYRRMNELRIGILGVGSIGLHVAMVLKTGFSVSVVRGMARTKKNTLFVDEWYTASELPAFLHGLDYIINTLPTTKHTRDLLSGEALQHNLDRTTGSGDAVLINVGRGAIIDTNHWSMH